MPSATLIPPPPEDPSKSPIENVLALTPLYSIGPDIFTNTRELWHPPGARGVYGGAVIAQCLSAAQATIPASTLSFLIHSMHCYFVLAGDASIPILYHVERVRDGKSFVTRTVQARQRGKCIFTTTLSFMKEGSAGLKVVEHGWGLPEGVEEGLDAVGRVIDGGEEEDAEGNGEQIHGPFVSRRLGIWNNDSQHPYLKKPQQWIRSRGPIPASSGPQAHLVALAYMSDSWFIGTVARVHNLYRFGGAVNRRPTPSPRATASESAEAEREGGQREAQNSKPQPLSSKTIATQLATTNILNPSKARNSKKQEKVGMMVSLDHTIYFHRPREVRVDEWMCSEMESPWAGEGRGVVTQRIWNRKGVLLATCVQEGLVRLVQDDAARDSKL